MRKTSREYTLSGYWKPQGMKVYDAAPLHDWMIVMQPRWGDHIQRNMYAKAITDLLRQTGKVGLCGRVIPEW